MPTATTDGTARGGRRWRWRIGVCTAFAGILGGLGVTLTPGTALAVLPRIPCPTDPNIIWEFIGAVAANIAAYQGVQYNVVTATPAFYASDGRVVDNALDTPISATFTSLQTRTLQISTMIGTSGQLVNKLQTTVSATIVATRSTAIGVNGMVTVPPHSRVVGTYGVEGFDIAYTGQTVVRAAASPTVCWDRGTQQGAVSAPTYLEGWKFTAG